MTNLNASEFDMKISEPEVILLDVRTASEFAQSHLPSSTNLDALQDTFMPIVSNFDRLKRYAVYCRSGKRSVDACEVMSELGFKYLFNLSGGIIEWIEAGKSITSSTV
jgi:rhodanese-related sulfurtransferase